MDHAKKMNWLSGCKIRMQCDKITPKINTFLTEGCFATKIIFVSSENHCVIKGPLRHYFW